jgi:molecular chaperone HscB
VAVDTRSPSDPFATLGLARSFDLDLAAAERTHRELSRALHPDKFVSAGASERRASLAKAIEVNEAWRTVRDPITRATALFALAGIEVSETKQPPSTPAFLMAMMEQREELAEARTSKNAARLDALAKSIASQTADAERALSEGFGRGEGGREALEPLVAKLGELRFYRRAMDEVGAIQEELEG